MSPIQHDKSCRDANNSLNTANELRNRHLATRLFVYLPVFRSWSFVPYIKCSFRCIYCCADVQGLSKPAVEPENFLATLLEEFDLIADISNKLDIPLKIYASLLTDCYVPQEKEYNYTRIFLQQVVDRSLMYQIITKGGLLLERDIDLFVASKTHVLVNVGLTAATNEQLHSIEPGTPSLDERLHCIEALNNAGVSVVVEIKPWIPGVTDIEAIVKLIPDNVRISIGVLEYQTVLDQKYFSPQHIEDKYAALRPGALSDKLLSFFHQGTCRSTKAVYGKKWSQQDINNEFIKERDRLVATLPNVFWATPEEWQSAC